MRNARLWARLLGVERIGIVDSVREEGGVFVVSVRPSKGIVAGAGYVSRKHRAMTRVAVGDVGVVWMLAR